MIEENEHLEFKNKYGQKDAELFNIISIDTNSETKMDIEKNTKDEKKQIKSSETKMDIEKNRKDKKIKMR